VKLLFGASDVKLNVRGGLKVTHYPSMASTGALRPDRRRWAVMRDRMATGESGPTRERSASDGP
jgi:hypothetical protein